MKRILLLGLLALTIQTKSMELAPSQRSTINTPLMQAVLNQNVEEVKALLDAGANPNEVSSEGDTPLIYATYKNNNEIVQELLKGGADVQIQNQRSKKIALDYAYENKNYLLMELLVAFTKHVIFYSATLESNIYNDVNWLLDETTTSNPTCYPINFLLEATKHNPNICIRLLQNNLPLIANRSRPRLSLHVSFELST